MSAQDQCPSSKKEGKAGKHALAQHTRELPRISGAAAGGRRAWRSMDEAADTAEFREFLEREFPAGASELNEPTTRRTFLQIMGASVALAGAATIPGCRRPEQHIMPYSAKVPEEVIPGKPLYYATSMPLPGGGAEGLLVETHEGRPTKVEGNPLHPVNRGKSTVWSQASILDLYDPDRLRYPTYNPTGKIAKWDGDVRPWIKDHFTQFDSSRGRGLAFIVQKRTSPSLDAIQARIMARFPQAMWVAYDPTDSDTPAAGSAAAFGSPMRDIPTIAAGGEIKAKVIVSLDRDFLGQADAFNLVHQREFAATRRVLKTSDQMSRLYVVEPGFSVTGSAADHRLRLAPSRVAALAVQLARAVLERVPGGNAGPLVAALGSLNVPAGDDIHQEFVDAIADDLVAEDDGHGGKTFRKGQTLILAGPGQPAAVHAITHALNQVLGNIGSTVRYVAMTPGEAASSSAGLRALSEELGKGHISTVVCVNANPVYDAPAGLDFAANYAKAATRLCLSVGQSETAAASTWSLNGAHYLECWGDTRSWDGTIAPIQPMIAPLYAPAKSDIEFLAMIADPGAGIVPQEDPVAAAAPGAPPRTPRVDDGHTIVRATWRQILGAGVGEAAFEKIWKRALHDGVLADSTPAPQSPGVDFAKVAAAAGTLTLGGVPSQSAMEAVFAVGHMADGRFANNGWLQELPQTGTRVVWDNPALLSPATAEALGLLPQSYTEAQPGNMYTQKYPAGRMARITVGGRSVEMAVWIMPGMADNTVILPLGYGRKVCGRVGDGVGFSAYAARDAASPWSARGATVEKIAGDHPISSTQNHWSLEGRTAIVRQVDLPAWQKHGDEVLDETDRLYGTTKSLKFGERVGHGELTHTPPNISIYPNPFQDSPNPQRPGDRAPESPRSADGTMFGRGMEPEPGSVYAKGPQWGMSIDLSTCTGCGACTIACQAENNIAIVGKKEVAKGRSMAWIRVDRYFVSDTKAELNDISNPIGMLHQPVACVHCENAPCETVCPVNATVHGPEGLNYMTYNRCIGTRYCANNCPYKVRRFNFFDYGVTRFNGDYLGKDVVEAVVPDRGGITGSGEHNKLNPNLIPPRLREKLEEITRMQKNPDVTVRSRGVMEKCSYCIQRINESRIEMKLHDLKTVPDGFVKSACQQACPSEAIYFGDILDKSSHGGKGSVAYQMRENARSYLLLGYLNTRPRTTHMVRVANPNPKLVDAHRKDEWEHPFGHHGGDSKGGEGGGHGGGAAGEAHSDSGSVGMTRSTFLRDSAKKVADHGYALSLRVLGV